MSAYENYTAVSADYDRTRVPIGVEIILGCLVAEHDRRLSFVGQIGFHYAVREPTVGEPPKETVDDVPDG